jgi:hydroxyacylglutathione hydrolase
MGRSGGAGIRIAPVAAGAGAAAFLAAVAWRGPQLAVAVGRLQRHRLRRTDEVRLGPGLQWFDDYFAVQYLDEHTVAICEPRYHQENISYLLIGEERALLFDTGRGLREIAAVVEHLTRLPLVVVCSHMHYDHVGRVDGFRDVRLPDLPEYRACVSGRVFRPPRRLHLGGLERVPRPSIRFTHWLQDGDTIDLGDRSVQLVHLPGHTSDSVGLHDRGRNQVFLGDFVYPKGIYAFIPTSNLADYLRSTQRLLELIDDETAVLVAHNGRPAVAVIPVMDRNDLVTLSRGLHAVIGGRLPGTGFFPRRHRISRELSILADFPWKR